MISMLPFLLSDAELEALNLTEKNKYFIIDEEDSKDSRKEKSREDMKEMMRMVPDRPLRTLYDIPLYKFVEKE